MADELLRTKLMPPPGHVALIERGRLQSLMELGLRLPLTLVVAPAGSGKTSLVRSWRTSELGRATPLAWVALDEHDNDPVRFWRYVIAALETLAPDFGDAARSYLDAAQQSSVQPALVSLINRLAELDERWVLALDDYHLIESPEIHEELTFFVENLPGSLRLLLMSRADPPLPLARWRARGQMMEIRNADLRFTEDETIELMDTELDAGLSKAQIATLNARTEGWAAGLHLAALALRGRDDADAFLQSFSGSHHFVLAYLAEDVLDRQPPEILDFLVKTSILSQLSGPLCDAVTGHSDGAEMLRSLAAVNLFTMPLDDEGIWYRYHHLFVEVLQHQLRQRDPGAIPRLHWNAAEWYEMHGLTTQAIDHALKADDSDRAARLIQSVARDTLSRGEARLMRRWISSVPRETLERNTRLLMAGAWSQLITGPFSEMDGWFAAAERALPNDPQVDPSDFKGEAAALRTVAYSFQGMIHDTIEQAHEARRHLTDRDPTLRGLVAMSLGQAYRFEGRNEEASEAYREAVEMGLAIGNLFIAIDSMADLGVVLLRQGKLREANAMLKRAQQVIVEHKAEHLPVAGAVATIWPDILFEMNEPEKGLELARHGLELGRRGAKTDLLVNGHRSIGTACWALRRWEEALEENRRSAEVSRSYGLIHTTRATEARIAHIHLTRGDLAAAQAWAASFQPDQNLPGFAREVEQLMLARVCVASGDPSSALKILKPLFEPANEAARVRSLMEILNLEALAYYSLGDKGTALDRLGQSLQRAAPEGYIRMFLDEGPAMTALLRLAVADDVEASFAGKLLTLMDDDGAGGSIDTPGQDGLIEPLSEREQAVLRLMAAGLTAPEIGNELYVAASTIRTHLKNLYRKLDVHSRDQAVARARDLDLV